MGSSAKVDSLRAVTRARSALDAATAAYGRSLLDARDDGKTLAEIAAAAGITRQGVWKATAPGRARNDGARAA